MPLFVGLDWGGVSHAVCVIDDTGHAVARFKARHDAAGPADLLGRLGRAADLPVAIERPSSLMVDALVEAGYPVVPIHLNGLKACRPRYRAAGAKSDPGDAYMLADILDGHRCGPARTRSRRCVRWCAPATTSSPSVSLLPTSCAASWKASGPAPPSSPPSTARSRLPSLPAARHPRRPPAAARSVRRASWPSTPIAGRRSPAELLARPRAAPAGRAGEAEADAKGESARALAGVLQRLAAEIAKLAACIERAVAGLADDRIIMSFPRAGRICAAQILAERGDGRDRFPTEDHLAAKAGVAPVTHASGKSRGVVSRWACNKRLRATITCLADNSRHASLGCQHLPQGPRADAATPTPCAFSPAPGSVSFGALGRTPSPAIRPSTAAPLRSPRENFGLDAGCLIALRGAE